MKIEFTKEYLHWILETEEDYEFAEEIKQEIGLLLWEQRGEIVMWRKRWCS